MSGLPQKWTKIVCAANRRYVPEADIPTAMKDGMFRACAASREYASFSPTQPFRRRRRAPMLARTDTVATISESWLVQFEGALAAPGQARLKTLFHSDSHWRDVLALTWHIKTVNGSDAILR